MTNFDLEARNELIISDVEAKEIARQISGHNLRSKNVRKQQQEQHDMKEMDATQLSYLQTTYTHLHENQTRKLNDIFAVNDEEERASTKRLKRKLKKMDVVEEQNMSYESCEVNELTREMQSMRFGEIQSRPIITFTPVHSGGSENELTDCPPSPSSFSDHVSSGSSSPLLEVPACEFRDMTAERMRPPLN